MDCDISGKTEEGKLVISGVFKLYDTLGLPLEILFMEMKKNDLVPDWVDFYNCAIAQGWKKKTILSRLGTAIRASYGKEFELYVLKILDNL